jgi:hypothetical protein
MTRLKILREDVEEIVAAADKLARRSNARFELNNEKVEIVDHFIPEQLESHASVQEDELTELKIA